MKIPSKLKIGLGLAVVFVGGLVCGSVGTLRYTERIFIKSLNYQTWSGTILKGLDSDLNLSADQHEKARATLDETVEEMTGMLRQIGVAFIQLHFRLHAILTPEQQAKHSESFNNFRRELKERYQITLPPDSVTNSPPTSPH